MRSSLLALLLLTFTAGAAHGQLVLNVDHDAETLWFTGSDTGQLIHYGDDTPSTYWRSDNYSGAGNYVTVSSAFSSSEGTVFLSDLTSKEAGGIQLELYLTGTNYYPPGSGPVATLTAAGSSIAFSYQDFSDTSKSTLEGATSIPLGFGNGFNAITVNQISGLSAVPEPSSYAAIFGGMALAGSVGMRRRRRQSNARDR